MGDFNHGNIKWDSLQSTGVEDQRCLCLVQDTFVTQKSDKTKVKQRRRDFRKGNYKEIRKRLALIDGNDQMKNKTATECWNILIGQLDSAIDSYVPMKKQGKRSKKKYLSKEAFRKIRYKQNRWRVYKHTGKDNGYGAYKEALNAATNEVRKSKRNLEHKLAHNIQSNRKSFYAYVRSKQNVRDKIGPSHTWIAWKTYHMRNIQ